MILPIALLDLWVTTQGSLQPVAKQG